MEWILHEKAGYDYFELPKLTKAELNRLTEGMRVKGKRQEHEQKMQERMQSTPSVGAGAPNTSGVSNAKVQQHKRAMAENQDAYFEQQLQDKARKN